VVGVDVARCLALLGMMATHVLDPIGDDGRIAWPQELAGGRSSALFAVLAGVSMSFMTGGRRPHRDERRLGDIVTLTTRATVIGLVGLWLGQLDTQVAVILVYYAVLFMLGLPFLGLGPRPLLALSALWCVAAPALSHLVRRVWGEQSPTVPSAGADSVAASLMDVLFTGYYPAVPWLTYLLAGMAIGRLDLTRAAVAVRALVVGVLLATAAWGLSAALTAAPAVRRALLRSSDGAAGWDALAHQTSLGMHGTTPTGSWWWLAVAAPHSGTPLDLAHTTGTAVAVLGAALLVTRWRPGLWAVLLGAGAMTLTLYTLHVVLLTPDLWPESTVANYARHAALVLAVGAAFALAGGRGPLEAATRLLSGVASRVVMGREQVSG
jgi:hypothetical protein